VGTPNSTPTASAPAQYDIADHDLPKNDPRRLIDVLLFELGDDGSAHPGPLTYLQRWAMEKRRRFGPALSARLIEMHKVVRSALQDAPPPKLPEADSPGLKIWAQAHIEVVRRALASLEDEGLSPADRARTLQFLQFKIENLETDPEIRAELSALLLAKTPPEVGFGPATNPAAERDGS
jgi:hypothetical protein